MWHVDNRRVSYEFLEQGWNLQEESLDTSREALKKRLTELLQSDHLLPYKAVMPDFYNEHALVCMCVCVCVCVCKSEGEGKG